MLSNIKAIAVALGLALSVSACNTTTLTPTPPAQEVVCTEEKPNREHVYTYYVVENGYQYVGAVKLIEGEDHTSVYRAYGIPEHWDVKEVWTFQQYVSAFGTWIIVDVAFGEHCVLGSRQYMDPEGLNV